MSVVTELRQFRKDADISLRALDKLAGIPYARICKIENGKVPLIYEDLIRLCVALNVPDVTRGRWVHALTKGILVS